MLDSETWSLSFSIVVFSFATILIVGFGSWLAKLADHLADRTGLGEALMGALFLGAATSLPEITTTTTAAITDHADLAISTALGGIAAQTVFLSLADMTYKRANLEHAAASMANIMQGLLAIALLTTTILAFGTSHIHWFGIHPATPFMIGAYLYGLHLVYKTQAYPMWKPQKTSETKTDVPDPSIEGPSSLLWLWALLLFVCLIVGIAGWLIAKSGIAIATHTGLSETIIGVVLVSISTSFPELVTALAAVRHGALTLAVGGILGGNAFDTLLVAWSDLVYQSGTIYEAISHQQVFLMALTILMTVILIMGLVRREKSGIGNIGFESFLILVLYVGAIVYLFAFEQSL
ncbi:hypothetical protein [Candidatus Nitronereus thalassa]|uniref:Sodium/calcium exchanger membrane region domain-containing protein n=1 Tax=Candidatus Nitronereus thalassa TaxID=3020898 RepID=A0ABU3KBQ0_9BACT|nr:hypothetical protein [Candidatus Nitronereus thalassa]MDT7043748.1 hypothetical protein [Candidatus Nitronereus thalassa]